jgi:leucyl/phenylalanyl-tRNA--protein transferase
MKSVLSTEKLLDGYANGIFPMANEAGTIEWYEADPRAVVEVDQFRIPHEVRRHLRQRRFEIRFDTAFEQVMRQCADRRETWISEEIISAYTELHRRGHAHSVEAWQQGRLAGGVYGVCLGAAFFGESMFFQVPGASKVALASLCEHLRNQRFALHDIQQMTPTLALFGAKLISKQEYLMRLSAAIRQPRSFYSRSKVEVL